MVQQFKNKHDGERAFLIGNGPSLKHTPLEQLQGEITFAMNKIDLIYGETSWRPTYYMYLKKKIEPDNAIHYRRTINLGIPCFINYSAAQDLPNVENIFKIKQLGHVGFDLRKDVYRIGTNEILDNSNHVWSDDLAEGVYRHSTSIYMMFQLASYMGISKMYLLGCDLGYGTDKYQIFNKGSDPAEYNYENENKRHKYVSFIRDADYPVRSAINGLVWKFLTSRVGQRFVNETHFTDDYSDHISGALKDDKFRQAHELARKILLERNINVYNSTIGGELEVHPRSPLDKVLMSS